MRFAIATTTLATLALACYTGRAAEKEEEGFTSLFNGKDLTGWKTKAGESLEGKTEFSQKRFRVMDEMLVIDEKVKGDVTIFTVKEFKGDVHLKFEFRPGPGCNNDILFRGLKFDIKKEGVKDLKEGQWHELEIVVKGNTAEVKCNGETMRTANVKPSGNLGLRAEYFGITFRKLRIKE
jgi:hypothetical protein